MMLTMVRYSRSWRHVCATLGVYLVVACGADNAPPRPPTPGIDGGSESRDGSQPDSATYIRPDGGPRLPAANGLVELPFLAPTQVVFIDIDATLLALDVQLSVDTTASFGGEIDALQRDLSGEVLPALRQRVGDVSVGVSSFADFPTWPFGGPDDLPFRLQTAITSDRQRVDSALAGLDRPLSNGGDGPESGAEALYQIATGDGYRHDGNWLVRPYSPRGLTGGGTLGGVGFREGALHVVVHMTDAPAHRAEDYLPYYPNAHSLHEAITALNALDVHTIGIASHPIAREHLETAATGTRAVIPPTDGMCATGIDGAGRLPIRGACPLVFDVRDDGEGLSNTLTDAIVSLLDEVSVERAYVDVRTDQLGFVAAVEAVEAEAPDNRPAPMRVDERPVDGIVDTFVRVYPGTRLRFGVHLRNTLLVEDDAPQFYAIQLELLGDGLSLGRRTIRVQVPMRSHDAGMDAQVDASREDDASTL